ncbi:MAG: hypothetical protein ACW981_16055 [Candidatus Hodarchaeales archaeon]
MDKGALFCESCGSKL